MTEHAPDPQPDGQPHHPAVRHEHTDVSFKWIAAVVAACAAGGILIQLGVWVVLRTIGRDSHAAKVSPFPLAPTPSTALPARPRLEQIDRLAGDTSGNVYLRMESRLEHLETYGPVKDEPGFAHVPIDRAIEQLAGKLPHRKPPSAGELRRAGGLVGAGEPNSGRVFRRGGE
jgi:hypothetical protein